MRTYLSMDKINNGAWLLIYLIFIISPVFFLMVETLNQLFSGNAEWLSLTLPTGRRLQLLARSTGLASLVALGGGLLGLLAGNFLSNWRPRVGSYLKYMILVLAVVPPYIHALSWASAFRFWNDFAGSTFLPELPMYGLFISWWVQFMALAPFGVGMALLGYELVDKSLVDAGRVMKSDFKVFKKVVLPAAAPAIAAGSAFMFLISLMDYSVPSLFQVSTYSLEIFAEYSASYEPVRAFLLAFPLMILMILAASVFQAAFRNMAMSPKQPRDVKPVPLSFPPWFLALQTLAIVLIAFQVMVPVISLVFVTGSFHNLVTPIMSSLREISSTLIVASGAALFSLFLVAAPASHVSGGGKLNYIWWPVLILPLPIPAPLIGIGLIHLWNHDLLVHFYRTLLMPVLAGAVRFVPFGALIMLARFKRVDTLLLNAASVLQKNNLHTFLSVKLPMFGKDFLAVAGLIFVLTAGELAATLLVVPSGQSTLTIKIYNYMHYGESASVAGLSLLILAISLTMGIAIVRLLARERQRS